MLRALLPYWRPLKLRTAAGVAALLAAAGLELLLPWPVKWLVDYVVGQEVVPASLASVWPPMLNGGAGALLGVCLAAVLFAVLHRVATLLSQVLLIGVGGELVYQLRCRGYEQFCRLSLAYHDRSRVGDSLYRVAYDTQAAMSLVSGALVPFVQSTFLVAGILIVMLGMDVVLSMVAAAMLPGYLLCIRLFGGRMERAARRYHENESVLLSTVQESLSSMRTMLAYTREPDTSLRFGSRARESFRMNLSLVTTQLAFSTSVGIAMAIGTAIAMWVGAGRVLAGALSAGDVLVFLAYIGMLYQPVNAVSQSTAVLQSARAQLRRVFEILDMSSTIVDRPGAAPLAHVRGAVEFRDVEFGYDTHRPVLRRIALAVQPGEVVALVGPTGAGKSTLASLLLRFYDPTSGAVLLDGHDLRDLPLAWLRSQVSVVLQDALLLSGTIRDNIAYGRPDASRAEVEDAARRAQAHEFIAALPAGYDTDVAERGVNFSGGQKQRIAIARAFLKNAPILVLDEPTSALDAGTERALLDALADLVTDRTTFIIAHRLSTVRLAHRIVVLDHGVVLEQGSHETLMARDSFYRGLYGAVPRSPSVTGAAAG